MGITGNNQRTEETFVVITTRCLHRDMSNASTTPSRSIGMSEIGEDDLSNRRLSYMAQEIENIERSSENKKEEQTHNLRSRIHFCCTDSSSSKLAFLWEWVLAFLIMMSIVFYAFETFCTKPAHRPGYPSLEAFTAGEIFFTMVFTLELVIRCAASPSYFVRDLASNDRDPPFFVDPLNLLDFVAVMPWFLEVIFQPPTDPTALNLEFEIIKLLRVLRVFKIFRSFSGTAILVETATKSLKPLSLTLMMLFMFFTVVASLVFMLEPCADADCTFKDAFNTGYFLAITLTTVGYGDQIPTHPGARALAILTMMFGAVFLSMPIAVIGNKFELAYKNFEKRQAHKNPEKALENAKKEYQHRLVQRRTRITHGAFSMLYDFQQVEAILERPLETNMDNNNWGNMEQLKETNKNTNTAQSKYAVSGSTEASKMGRAKMMYGPAAEALSHLSRKHYFVSIDIRQLFRTNRVDKSLPIHIQELMKKITQVDGTTHEEERSEGENGANEFNKSVDVEQGKSGVKKPGDKKQRKKDFKIHHMITHKAPNGLPGMTKDYCRPRNHCHHYCHYCHYCHHHISPTILTPPRLCILLLCCCSPYYSLARLHPRSQPSTWSKKRESTK